MPNTQPGADGLSAPIRLFGTKYDSDNPPSVAGPWALS